MPIKCPAIDTTSIISDDPKLAAALSCALSRRGIYLPVLDGPRLTRPDRNAEVTRRVNVLARAGTKNVFLAGLSPEAQAVMMAKLPKGRSRVVGFEDITSVAVDPRRVTRPELMWGRDRIGLGVLTALYSGRLIAFSDVDSPRDSVPSKSEHLVVCEADDPLSEVIAANYACSMNAGLHIFDEGCKIEARKLLEDYYSIDAPHVAPASERARLAARLRDLVGTITLPHNGSMTYIVARLPFGVAFPELPSTHLFTYPDLGRTIVNGFAAEQPKTRGTNIAVLVDPQKVRAPEIEAAANLLPQRGVFVRGYKGAGATVRAVKESVELFPYDFLLFATHCGDVPGYRWTYEYRDTECIDRRLVVDIAFGVAQTDESNLLNVTQFVRFHSLDGVDWNDLSAKRLHVGTAIDDYIKGTKNKNLEPSKKEVIERVLGSAALALVDGNYLPIHHSLAAEGTPIILNNACVSWHELSERFMFADARAYIGTLYTVSDMEAEAIATGLIGKHFGKFLPHALWAIQNATYGFKSDRRPYVISGVYPQRLRVTRDDVPKHILSKLYQNFRYWKHQSNQIGADKDFKKKHFDDVATYYEREFTAFRERWFKTSTR